MNIIQAINDPNLFRPFLGDLRTWQPWLTALRTLYGLPITGKPQRTLLRDCSGRTTTRRDGFQTALFLTGRRSGKSRTAAVIGAYEAVLSGRERNLSKGERGIVLITSPTKSQSRIVRDYMRAVFDVPILSREVEREDQTGFDLRNNVRIEILSGDWRSVRGFTLLCAIVDEICFFGYDSDSKVRSDTELIRAIQPSLATSGGKLIGISSPYAEKGWSFNQFKRHWANDKSSTLVWKCPSRIMNSTLPQSIVDEALAEDLAAARAEYLAEFRQDVASYLPREVIEACVAKGRQQLSPQSGNRYSCFVDISGGRSDDAAMCIAHRDTQTQKIVVDFLRRWRPPFSPDQVISQMVELLAPYRIDRVNGDNYSAEFCKQSFETRGIRYNRSTGNVWNRNQSLQQTKSKSVLYLEMLPRLCSREVELLDDPTLINQLAGLERRTRSGGRDTVDHGPNGHDDCANAVAGAVDLAARSGRMLQVAGGSSHQGGSHLNNIARARAAWCSGIVPDSDRSPFHILGD